MRGDKKKTECDHRWKINENDTWTDERREGEETVIVARYHATTRTCSRCKKFEIISGNVISLDSGAEYLLNSDGTWGMGVSI